MPGMPMVPGIYVDDRMAAMMEYLSGHQSQVALPVVGPGLVSGHVLHYVDTSAMSTNSRSRIFCSAGMDAPGLYDPEVNSDVMLW